MPLAALGPASRVFFSQRLRLHYADWGNPDAPPLVLVHGGRDHCRNWDWVAAELRRDWHVIAPDLRGHGDSAWTSDGHYNMAGFVYDLAQLVHQQGLAPVTIVAHSLGGAISLRYTGIYPGLVRKLVAIEGLVSPSRAKADIAIGERMRGWVDEQRGLAGRQPRRYPSIADACARMQAENKRLSPAQAWHLTAQGMNQNEDGTYSWKFDNYVRAWPPYDMSLEETQALWSEIACPTLLVYGRESWATDPETDGRIRHFKNARVAMFEGAGHWVHHDRLDAFLAEVRAFLQTPLMPWPTG